jgi:hypothetical protein
VSGRENNPGGEVEPARVPPQAGFPSTFRILWSLLKGYRLQPWRSPYLRWRIETWSGMEAAGITPRVFLKFSWQHRADLARYLKWAAENSRSR